MWAEGVRNHHTTPPIVSIAIGAGDVGAGLRCRTDNIAFKIRQIARAHDVPIVENVQLARALYATVEIDQEIPVEHYHAVAEIIGYVMGLSRNFAGRRL